MFRPGGYDPVKFLSPLAKVADELNLEGVHLFTFNNIDATAEWQRHYRAFTDQQEKLLETRSRS